MINSQKMYRKITALVFAMMFVFAGIMIVSPIAHADDALSGWAWSSNIGWINFNSTDNGASGGPYSVVIDSTQTPSPIKGYAWSSNIGWIKFDGLSSYPSGGSAGVPASVNLTTGEVKGWIRACAGTVGGLCGTMTSRTDGWDGWIELAGSNHASLNTAGTGGVTYDPATKKFVGYAWGGDVVGWVQFNPTLDASHSSVINTGGQSSFTCSISATPTTITSGGSSNINWNSSQASSCTAYDGSGNSIGTGLSGTVQVSPTNTTNYSLSCSDASSNICPSNTTLTVTPQVSTSNIPLRIVDGGQDKLDIKVKPGSTINLKWDTSDLNTGGTLVSNSCVGYAKDINNNAVLISNWSDGTQLPDYAVKDNYPVTINDKGDYTMFITCFQKKPDNSNVTVQSNDVKVKVTSAIIEEK